VENFGRGKLWQISDFKVLTRKTPALLAGEKLWVIKQKPIYPFGS